MTRKIDAVEFLMAIRARRGRAARLKPSPRVAEILANLRAAERETERYINSEVDLVEWVDTVAGLAMILGEATPAEG
jgi:hypothetical protein